LGLRVVTITVYTGILSDGEFLVEACWRAIEVLRLNYGITPFLEVLESSLLAPLGSIEPVVLVGGRVIRVDMYSDVEEIVRRIVDAVLENIVLRDRWGEAVEVPGGPQRSWYVEEVSIVEE